MHSTFKKLEFVRLSNFYMLEYCEIIKLALSKIDRESQNCDWVLFSVTEFWIPRTPYQWSLPVLKISIWATEFRPSLMNVTLTYKSEIIFYHGPRSEVNRKPVFLFEVHLLDRIKLCLFVKMNFEIILELSSLIKQVSEVLH